MSDPAPTKTPARAPEASPGDIRAPEAGSRRRRKSDPLSEWLARSSAQRMLAAIVALGLCLSATTQRVWRGSPAGFRPEVRLSVIDLLWQALDRRAARRRMAMGRPGFAASAWLAALQRNPADLPSLRGLLQAVAGFPGAPADLVSSGETAAETLALVSPTMEDAGLEAAFFRQHRLWGDILRHLGDPNWIGGRTTALSLLEASWAENWLDGFDQVRKRAAAPLAAAPEADWMAEAWLVARGAPREREAAQSRLKAIAAGNPAAARWWIEGNFKAGDRLGFEAALEAMEDGRLDRPDDHVCQALLLAADGRKADAQRAYQRATNNPAVPPSAELRVAYWGLLGSGLEASAFARRRLDGLIDQPKVLLAATRWLAIIGRWSELSGLAIGVRSEPRLRHILGDFASFLDGLTHISVGDTNGAQSLAAAFAAAPAIDPRLNLASAALARRYGLERGATAIANAVAASAGKDTHVWLAAIWDGFAARDAEMLWVGGEYGRRLAPDDPVFLDAAVLARLILRRDLSGAAALGEKAVVQKPLRPSAALHKAWIAAATGRPEEAERWLALAPANSLGPELLAERLFVELQMSGAAGDSPRFAAIARALPRFLLFPEQQRWLDQQLSEHQRL